MSHRWQRLTRRERRNEQAAAAAAAWDDVGHVAALMATVDKIFLEYGKGLLPQLLLLLLLMAPPAGAKWW